MDVSGRLEFLSAFVSASLAAWDLPPASVALSVRAALLLSLEDELGSDVPLLSGVPAELLSAPLGAADLVVLEAADRLRLAHVPPFPVPASVAEVYSTLRLDGTPPARALVLARLLPATPSSPSPS